MKRSASGIHLRIIMFLKWASILCKKILKTHFTAPRDIMSLLQTHLYPSLLIKLIVSTITLMTNLINNNLRQSMKSIMRY